MGNLTPSITPLKKVAAVICAPADAKASAQVAQNAAGADEQTTSKSIAATGNEASSTQGTNPGDLKPTSKPEANATAASTDKGPNNTAGPVVTNPNGKTEPTTPGVTDNFHPKVGGLKNGQVLNQNAYFETRWPGWTNAMKNQAGVAVESLATTGKTGGLDGNVFLTPGNSAVYGDEKMTFVETNWVTGSFTYVIDQVTPDSARIRVLDGVGFDTRDKQGNIPLLKDAFPDRTVTRATWQMTYGQ